MHSAEMTPSASVKWPTNEEPESPPYSLPPAVANITPEPSPGSAVKRNLYNPRTPCLLRNRQEPVPRERSIARFPQLPLALFPEPRIAASAPPDQTLCP